MRQCLLASRETKPLQLGGAGGWQRWQKFGVKIEWMMNVVY